MVVELWSDGSLVSSGRADLVRNDAAGRSGFEFREGGPFDIGKFESGALRVVAKSGDASFALDVWAGVKTRLERAQRERFAAKGRLVALIGKQRSGTTAIGKLVASHPGAFYAGEIFHSVRGPQDDLEYRKYLTVPEVNFFAWRERLFGRFPSLSYPSHHNQKAIWQEYIDFLMSRSPIRMVVLDIKFLHHMNTIWHDPHDPPHILALLKESGALLLHITRDDYFAQAASAIRAAYLKKYHALAKEAANSVPVKLDPYELERLMAENERTVIYLHELLKRYSLKVELEYSECLQNDRLSDQARQAISSAILIPEFSPGIAETKKLTREPIGALTPNAEEILSYFRGRKYENQVRAGLSTLS